MNTSPFVATPPPLLTRPSRSRFVTLLGWVAIVISTLLLPISLITLLMIIAGSPGTANATLSGFFDVVCRPPATLIAGIGLLRRWRWARSYSLALLATFALWHVSIMARGPTPEHSYISPVGVPTTTLATDVDYPLHLAALAITVAVFLKLRTRSVRAEFESGSSPVKLSAIGGFIQSIKHRVRATRAQPPVLSPFTTQLDAREISPSVLKAKRRSQHRALLIAIGVMALIAAGTGWLVHRGLATGEIYSPTKRASQRRIVVRSQEPAFFWVSISIYALLSAGSAGLAVWGTREAFQLPSAGRNDLRPDDPRNF